MAFLNRLYMNKHDNENKALLGGMFIHMYMCVINQ